MSIVGAQGVSMSELTGMGLDRLNAMAQGQQPSIAPSYLVLAAIEQLKKGKAGEQMPLPQGTVKDRLLASINQPPPMQAGIASVAPQPQQQQPMPQQAQPAAPTQRMSGGGQVKHFAEGGQTKTFLGIGEALGGAYDSVADTVGPWLRELASKGIFAPGDESEYNNLTDAQIKENMRRASAGEPKLTPAEVRATQATRVGTEVGRATNTAGAAVGLPSGHHDAPSDMPPVASGAGVSASARSRGVGSTGTSLLDKYDLNIPHTPSAASFQLNIPKNQQLADAAAKYALPDDKRMAELKGAEERAGLGAFARGMVNPEKGRGFGAVFGSAAADWNDAREKRADARREYEDKRQEMATKLSLMQGEEARENFLKNSEWGAKRAQEAWEQAAKGTEIKMQGTHYNNQEILDREKTRLMAEANRIAAEARRDGLTAAHHDRIQKLYLTAQEIAIKAADSTYGKIEGLDEMSPLGQDRMRKKRTLYEAEYAKAVRELEARLGGEGNSRAAGTATVPVRKVYGP